MVASRITLLGPRRFKYPRTLHLPWSLGIAKDDRRHSSLDAWAGVELVATEKMDGENTTVYQDGSLHARSIDSGPHPSRNRVKADAQKWSRDLPLGWRACGENLTARHSIAYENLTAPFLAFSIWNEERCLSWEETEEWVELLGLETPKVIWRGVFETETKLEKVLENSWVEATGGEEFSEGYVVRPTASFLMEDFSRVVGKFVRAGHVAEGAAHWSLGEFEKNLLK